MMGWFKKEIVEVASEPIGEVPVHFADPERPEAANFATGGRSVVRKDVYSVRVRKGFKQDIAELRRQLISERQGLGLSAAKMTDGSP